MLFNSVEFIFLFLPITVLAYLLLERIRAKLAIAWLVLASLFFYGYWNPAYLLLISASILFNYSAGKLTQRHRGFRTGRLVLALAIAANLLVLAYFKYANFFVDNANYLLSQHWDLGLIVLPLAISFFTFQQISYLVDVYEGKASEYSLLHYALFVSFFPQLIAGPIVHHREMLPQFMRSPRLSHTARNIAIGISIFSIGLFKKTVIADSLSQHVGPVYDNPAALGDLELFGAWTATLAYTFQLYFDFSGYSDMAIGCARLFGIILPVNFFSPYKAFSIVDFWRRWHITLSRFLRDYLYIALGGNRKGRIRRYINLLLTMLLGGLWHGAGWPFVVWGLLHGFYLVINHAWNALLSALRIAPGQHAVYRAFSWLLTFLAVVVSWVFFRAPTLEHASGILYAMAGLNGASLPAGLVARLGELQPLFAQLGIKASPSASGSQFIFSLAWIVVAAVTALFAPNVTQIFCKYRPALFESELSFADQRMAPRRLRWRLTPAAAGLTALLLVLGILTLNQVSEFLYFQF